MHSAWDANDATGLRNLAGLLSRYLADVDGMYCFCKKHDGTSAIHTKGKELQVYRMYLSGSKLAGHLHEAVAALPGWEESPYWSVSGSPWEKLRKEVEDRVEQHSSQVHIASRGVLWEDTPVLIHAYKFDADKYLKIELIMPEYEAPLPILPLRRIIQALHCHEFLVPEFIAKPKPPYAGHEAEFQTLTDYLSRTMPPELYATRCFPLHRLDTS